MGIQLATVVLSSGDDVLILAWRTLRVQLDIDVMGGLTAKALGLQEVKKNDQVAICRGTTGEYIRARHVSVSLSVVRRFSDREKGVPKEDKSFKRALLARGPLMAIESEHEHMLRFEALTEALEQATQEGIPLGLLKKMEKLVLREIEDVFREGLTGKLPASVTSMRLR